MADIVDAIPDSPARHDIRSHKIGMHRTPRLFKGKGGWNALWRRAERAEKIITEGVRKRGKETLEEILVILMDMALEFKPAPAGNEKKPHEDRDLFDRYIMLAMKCAAEVAPYQSAKAILIKNASGQQNGEYDLDQLSDEQLLTLRTLMIAAKPVTIEGTAKED